MKPAKIIVLSGILSGLVWAPGAPAKASDLSASDVVRNVRDTFGRLEDYRVRVWVHVSIEGFQFPDQDVGLYYKSPDQIHLEGASLGMIPRQAVMANPSQLLDEEKFEIRLAGTESLEDRSTYRLDLTSREWEAEGGEESGPDLKAWVDVERWVIVQMEAHSDGVKQGLLTIDHILVADRYWLPEHTGVEIYMNGARPSSPHSPGDSTLSSHRPEKGTIELTFHDYEVNVGLPDSLFIQSGTELE